jgi:hypothetical protein
MRCDGIVLAALMAAIPGRRSVMFLAADHDDGAVRVMHAVLADRAEQRPGESAMPAAPV